MKNKIISIFYFNETNSKSIQQIKYKKYKDILKLCY